MSPYVFQEGENNDKFNSHPRDRSALPAYLVTHNHWFYSLDLFAAILLMSLATIEPPAVFKVRIRRLTLDRRPALASDEHLWGWGLIIQKQ